MIGIVFDTTNLPFLFSLIDRHDEFLKLERSIREVAEMFRELEGLIAQQGDLVNNIAHNVEQATEKVAKGRKQLSDAERHQRSARRKKVICAIIIFVAVLIILLIILGEFGVFSSSGYVPVEPVTYPPSTSTTTIPSTSPDPTISPDIDIEPTIGSRR